jgi:hypothetical protein
MVQIGKEGTHCVIPTGEAREGPPTVALAREIGDNAQFAELHVARVRPCCY